MNNCNRTRTTLNFNNNQHGVTDKFNRDVVQTLENNSIVRNLLDQFDVPFERLNRKHLNIIYGTIQPYIFQQNKIFQCIERLDRIISITQSKRKNLLSKVEHIAAKEKDSLTELMSKIKMTIEGRRHRRNQENSTASEDRRSKGQVQSKMTCRTSETSAIDIDLNKMNNQFVEKQKVHPRIRCNSAEVLGKGTTILNQNMYTKTGSLEKISQPNGGDVNKGIRQSKTSSIPLFQNNYPKNNQSPQLQESKIRSPRKYEVKKNNFSDIKKTNNLTHVTTANKTKRSDSVELGKISHPKNLKKSAENLTEVENLLMLFKDKSNTWENERKVKKTQRRSLIASKATVTATTSPTHKLTETNNDRTMPIIENSILLKHDLESESNDLIQKIITKFDTVKQFIDKHKRVKKSTVNKLMLTKLDSFGSNEPQNNGPVIVEAKYATGIENPNKMLHKTNNSEDGKLIQRHLKEQDIVDWLAKNTKQQNKGDENSNKNRTATKVESTITISPHVGLCEEEPTNKSQGNEPVIVSRRPEEEKYSLLYCGDFTDC